MGVICVRSNYFVSAVHYSTYMRLWQRDEVGIFVFQKGGIDYLKKEDADVYGFQEVKCSTEDLPKVSNNINT